MTAKKKIPEKQTRKKAPAPAPAQAQAASTAPAPENPSVKGLKNILEGLRQKGFKEDSAEITAIQDLIKKQ